MKRFYLVLVCFWLIFPVSVLIAGGSQEQEKVELSFLSLNAQAFIDKYTAVFEDITKRHPNLDITYDMAASTAGYGWEGMSQKFFALMAAGTPPDLIYHGVAWLPHLAERGYMTPLDNYIKKLNANEYAAGSLTWLKYTDGNTYFIADGSFNMALYYNKDMFDAAGFNYPSPHAESAITLDEFFATAKALTKGEGADRKFGVYADLHPERSLYLLWAKGAAFFNQDMTKCILNSPEGIEVYSALVDTILNKYSPDSALIKTIPINDLFTSGKIGMMFNGPYEQLHFGIARDEANGPRFGVACVPREKYHTTIQYLDALGIPAGVKHPDEAFFLLSELINVEAGTVAAKQGAQIAVPINLELLKMQRPNMYSHLDTEAEKAVFFNALEYAKPFPFNPSWHESIDAARPYFDQMSIGTIGVEDGVNKLVTAVNKVIEENM